MSMSVMYLARLSRPVRRTLKGGNMRLPALVMTISVPMAWKRFHRSRWSRMTRGSSTTPSSSMGSRGPVGACGAPAGPAPGWPSRSGNMGRPLLGVLALEACCWCCWWRPGAGLVLVCVRTRLALGADWRATPGRRSTGAECVCVCARARRPGSDKRMREKIYRVTRSL